MRIRTSSRARSDVEKIAHYIGLDNKAKARQFVQLVEETISHISKVPYAYPFYYADARRKIVNRFSNYAILYRVNPDYIKIVTIYHMSRDNI